MQVSVRISKFSSKHCLIFCFALLILSFSLKDTTLKKEQTPEQVFYCAYLRSPLAASWQGLAWLSAAHVIVNRWTSDQTIPHGGWALGRALCCARKSSERGNSDRQLLQRRSAKCAFLHPVPNLLHGSVTHARLHPGSPQSCSAVKLYRAHHRCTLPRYF